MNLLIIGHTFPEPDTTAAGSRMLQLIEMFKEQGARITFATTASRSERSVRLENLMIDVEKIELNDSSFDNLIKELNPEIVVFDRYITEEQFGWRVAEICPKSISILDTEDLHFLRKAREEAVNRGLAVGEASLFSDLAKREIASILRCDVSFIISEAEMEILTTSFRISKDILLYLPFLVEIPSEENVKGLPKFEERNHFITVGNFQHGPNVDSVKWLQKEIWPAIKTSIPEAELHIYGAYAPQQVLELHNPKSGFLVKGWIENINFVMRNARVCLAPLRFGAGLKVKIFDAMLNGTAVVTTAIGAEGINGIIPFAGAVSDMVEGIVSQSIELYTDEPKWSAAQNNGLTILRERFNWEDHKARFEGWLVKINSDLEGHRNSNFISQILQYNTLNTTKFMSKWIEEKNRNK